MRSRHDRSPGFTQLEAIVTLGIFSGLLIAIFGTFSVATSIFQDTDVRQSSELQLRSIKLLLERDLELTDFWSIADVERTAPRRDAFSFVTLSDWNSPANFDTVSGRPLWNLYVVWYATQEEPGRLVRQLVDPGGTVSHPYAALSTNLADDPDSNRDVVYSRILSDRIVEFEVVPKLGDGIVTARVKLRAGGAKRPNSQENTVDNLDVSLTLVPRNTWPRI